MKAKFDDIVKDYILSFVENNEYSSDDHNVGSVFVRNLFSEIKGSVIDSNEDLQRLSEKYIMEKTGLDEKELTFLKNKLGNNTEDEHYRD